jgi:hypothetical protein
MIRCFLQKNFIAHNTATTEASKDVTPDDTGAEPKDYASSGSCLTIISEKAVAHALISFTQL